MRIIDFTVVNSQHKLQSGNYRAGENLGRPNFEHLLTQVHALMEDGWEPSGPVQCIPDGIVCTLIQSMVKREAEALSDLASADGEVF